MVSRTGHYEPIAREGHIFIAPLALISLGLWWFAYPVGSVVFLVLAVAVALFFRNPERISPQGDGIVLSPADGRVVQLVEQGGSKNLSGGPFKRISIFMSVFNVHVNRSPVAGKVTKVEHVPGGFLDARDPGASITNEHNCVVLDTKDRPIEVVQIAGKVARRIACWVREGDALAQGERFGLIRFGSRVDVYLPEGYSFIVDLETRVRAGVTVIARRDGAQTPEGPGHEHEISE
ncbi:MAG: phosphatidylserine decarboxylase family protein [Desulfomonile tiedjei]|nr:phosphatidylserine decarboxylase family protein [Desulfomonile tiedjei]